MPISKRDKQNKISRRQLVKYSTETAALYGLGGGLVTQSAWAADNRTLRVALSWIPNYEYSDLWIALEKGYYAADNLAIEWKPGGPNTPNPVERVASGEVDIGLQVTLRPVLEAISRGNDFVIFGARYQRRSGGILSLAKAPIKKVEDLVGKRIICPSPTDARTVETALKIANLPNDFTYVPGGYSPYGLLRGQGDGMVAFSTNQPLLLEAQGMVAEKDFFHRSWDELGQPGYNTLFFAQRDFLETNREAVVQFMRGLVRGWNVAQADMEYATKLTVDKYGLDFGLDYDQQLRALEVSKEFMHSADTEEHGLFWVDKVRLAGPVYAALRAGGVENLPDVESILDMSIVTQANSL
jgi:ABC-type nitrate/sulfonate/bicarbonate transport system substrate-binding protein